MSRTANNTELQPKASVPEGAPSWITPELIADTLETWQPYYDHELTSEHAIEIVVNVWHLIDLLEEAK